MPPVLTSSTASEVAPAPYQPFQCLVCFKRFTRQENLNRHASLHAPTSDGFPCDLCDLFFARADLRRRHLKTKHGDLAKTSQYFAAPTTAAAGGSSSARPSKPKASRSKSKSSGPAEGTSQQQQQQPSLPESFMDLAGVGGSWPEFDILPLASWASPGVDLGGPSQLASGSTTATAGPSTSAAAAARPSVDDHESRRSRSTASPSAAPCTKCASTSPRDHNTAAHDDWVPTPAQTARGAELFFLHISPWLDFLHEPTFDPATAARCVVIACMALGFAYGEDPEAPPGRAGSGDDLSLRCYDAARRLVRQREDDIADSTESLATIQASLLLQVYSMMYAPDSSDGLRMHSKMVSLSRSTGQMQPLPPGSMVDLEAMWREFVKAESHKRTLLALHHIDSTYYQLLSVPRLISHLEVKHDMPCDPSLWGTKSASEWAHKRLFPSHSAPTIRFCDAIKRVLNTTPESGPIPQEYLTVGVVHFLTSSLREVSGWSAMSGLVSPERFKALTASLAAIGPAIRASAQAEQSIVVEALVEFSMLETLSWSSAHMGGVVEVSLDAALATAAYLATSFGFIVEPDSARDLQQHVDWFLRYLDKTIVADREPPFVTVYAFKAFLIAWQLLHSGTPDAMTAVGIADGDSEGALAWATKVFALRARWKVGKLVLQNLKSLE